MCGGGTMERTAIHLSFWLGGCGLVALKGAAYASTGSTLVRTSMFESVGDVLSSLILWITNLAMNSDRNVHLYPVGRFRLAPIGVLFFCAFMLSSMCSMALDSFQQLLASEGDDAAAAEAAAGAVRRLAEDYWWLRFVSGKSVDGLIAEYGIAPGGDDSDSDASLWTKLLTLCVLVKLALYVFCMRARRSHASDILKALAADHRNDMVVNIVVICTVSFVAYMERCGLGGRLLSKIDPASSLALSLWIIYGWISQSLEQVKVLSDRRADEDAVDQEAIRRSVEAALQHTPLYLRGLDVYHAGEGFRLRLDLKTKVDGANPKEEALASALERAQQAALTAAGAEEVHTVEVCIRQHDPSVEPPAVAAAWVGEYRGLHP